ncbi:metallophosphoesterase [Tissierella sp. Yu-01]|uniref:metallophosphoesterase n=1 Tax=Tissierella sp. Yu-01 TaxID=3035694 RepID=UPI00240D682E|nr:metallophosphoesterase [Tissierella sp. Yu-01]WFA09951.1 metallophosphoesterase [Tissierella sp. Yu-01]
MIYAIADLHFDFSKEKPMDIFGETWLDHEEKIIKNWIDIVKEDDLVIIPGDISWALKLNEAIADLKRIDALPGKKVMLKGNHDYWWSSLSKLNGLSLNSIFFLQNNSYIFKDFGIVGTRGWIARDNEDFNEDDERIFERELSRFKLSLDSLRELKKKIAIIHYPPFNIDFSPNEFVDIMKEYGVETCLYGHLHSEGHKFVIEGNIKGINFHCVSSDYLDFIPKKIYGE